LSVYDVLWSAELAGPQRRSEVNLHDGDPCWISDSAHNGVALHSNSTAVRIECHHKTETQCLYNTIT
jgi:hypothetical protein